MNGEDDGVEYSFKVIVVGHSTAGKTSVIQRFTKGNFAAEYKATIGLDFFMKKINWKQNSEILLQLWDLGGQDRFTSLSRVYYREAIGAIVVFDCTEEDSLKNSMEWKADIDAKVVWKGKKIPTVLFANKIDLEAGSFMTDEVMNQICIDYGFVGWYRTSAKENIGIEGGIKELIAKIMEMGVDVPEEEDTSQKIQIRPKPQRTNDTNGCSC